MRAPKYLYIPPLYEESEAVVSWEDLPEATAYELDCSLDEEFGTAKIGKTWDNLNEKASSWQEIDNKLDASWSLFESQDAQGLTFQNLKFLGHSWDEWDELPEATWQWLCKHSPVFSIYRGLGEEVLSPDQGLSWDNLLTKAFDWEEWEDIVFLSWREFEQKISVGLHWDQLEINCFSWGETEANMKSWDNFEFMPAKGLTWGGLDGRCTDWENFLATEEGPKNWEELHNLESDSTTQKGVPVDIPRYSKKSQYRIRAFDENGKPSSYLERGLIVHRPRSLRKDTPHCLHIPTLREIKTAQIVWGDLYGAEEFILERNINNRGFTEIFSGVGKTLPYQCKELDRIVDASQHFHFNDHVPVGAKSVSYQLKARNNTDDSLYRISETFIVIPLFEREDQIALAVEKNRVCYVPLCALDIREFGDIPMTIEYDSTALEFMNAAEELNFGTRGNEASSVYQQTSHVDGKLVFTCKKSIAGETQWSGLVSLLKFRGKKAGNTTVKIY